MNAVRGFFDFTFERCLLRFESLESLEKFLITARDFNRDRLCRHILFENLRIIFEIILAET